MLPPAKAQRGVTLFGGGGPCISGCNKANAMGVAEGDGGVRIVGRQMHDQDAGRLGVEIGVKDSRDLIALYLFTLGSFFFPFVLGRVCLLRFCLGGSPVVLVHVQVEF